MVVSGSGSNSYPDPIYWLHWHTPIYHQRVNIATGKYSRVASAICIFSLLLLYQLIFNQLSWRTCGNRSMVHTTQFR
jgi:hypothetical protein